MSVETLLAEVAFTVYMKPEEVKYLLEDHTELTDIDYFSVAGCEGCVASNEEIIVVAFAGTNPLSLMDLMTGLKVIQVPTLYGKIHGGAYNYYTSVQDIVLDLVEKHKTNSQSVLACGHSLGGMIARIFCCDYAEYRSNSFPVEVLADFGCPNTGDSYFQTVLNLSVRRQFHFVNNCDIFPRLPSKNAAKFFSLNYESPTDMHYLSLKGNMFKVPPIAWWIICFDRIVGRVLNICKLKNLVSRKSYRTKGIKDHSMDEYLRKVRKSFRS